MAYKYLPCDLSHMCITYLFAVGGINSLLKFKIMLYAYVPKYENRFKFDKYTKMLSIVYHRDKTMSDEIVGYIKNEKPKETTVCVVGNGHLIGICYFLIQNNLIYENIEYYDEKNKY